MELNISKLLEYAEIFSTDKHTKVGCVITDEGTPIIVTANHHTKGIDPNFENTERPEKYDWIEHAERNAIYRAAKFGVSLEGKTMHIPGFPCVECARAIAQSGIKTLVHGSTEGWDEERYKMKKSRIILEAARVELIDRCTT